MTSGDEATLHSTLMEAVGDAMNENIAVNGAPYGGSHKKSICEKVKTALQARGFLCVPNLDAAIAIVRQHEIEKYVCPRCGGDKCGHAENMTGVRQLICIGNGNMVVLWCISCGALMGMREPLNEWITEKGICAACMKREDVPLPPDVPLQEPVKHEGQVE